ncbi:methionine synthase reductase [Choristoneura fumiferana]|uniref:methionine synthase reductase n=1 Tax=Choristoneura fumiferana TaxID=7141 RepID=UPI003D15E275
MVMSHNFQQIFDETSSTVVVTLPAFKETGLKLEFQDQKDTVTVYKDKQPPLPFARSNVFHAEISSWRRLTAVGGDCKTVYELTFDVKGSNFEFKAGDTIGILPRNNPDEVNAVLEHLGLAAQADLCYDLNVNSNLKGKIPAHVPVKSTIRHVLSHCVDLRSILKKLFILALSRHTKCDTERRALEYLCSKEGAASYTTHILNKNICLLDIFTIFKTCKPPIEILLANLPRLLPRPYSIVNSGLKDSSILKICFSVMTLENNRQGLTTSWLETLLELDNFENRMKNLSLNNLNKQRVPMYVRRNMADFSLPPNIKSHLLMIATGTGVAPFMGFLEERQMMKESTQSEMGEAWLFFGCRNPDFDYLYEGELAQYEDSMVLNKCITAFSRVKNAEARRVQNALCDNGEDVARLIKDGASVFVCGEAKSMVTQVKESIIGYLVKHGGQTLEEAEKYIVQMEKDKRYVTDLWS